MGWFHVAAEQRNVDIRFGKNNAIIDVKPDDDQKLILAEAIEAFFNLITKKIPLIQERTEMLPQALAGLVRTI